MNKCTLHLKRHGTLFLAMGGALLVAFKVWLVWGQSIQVETKYSVAWLQIARAYQLVHGNWLGDSVWWALYRPPGYSLWIALVYFIHVPLRLAIEVLWGLSAFALAFGLRSARAPLWLCLGSFIAVIFYPGAFLLNQRASSLTVEFPLLLLALSAGFCAVGETGLPRKIGCGALIGLFLALFWISSATALPALIILGCVFFWQLLANARSAESPPLKSRLIAVLATVLLPLVFVAVSDLSLRWVNRVHYREFALERHFTTGLLTSQGLERLPAPQDLFTNMTRHFPVAESQVLQVIGWAVDFRSPVRRVEILDEHGKILGETEQFYDRSDIQHYFEALNKTKVVSDLGFRVVTEKSRVDPAKMKLVFYNHGAERVEMPVKNDVSTADNFRYHLDLIETHFPVQALRADFIDSIRSWYETLAGAALFAAGLAAIGLALGYGYKATELQTLDFFLLALGALGSILSAWIFYRGGFRPDISDSRSYEVFAAVGPCLSLPLLYRGWNCMTGLGEVAAEATSRLLGFLASLRPEKVFLVLALPLGLAFLFLNPPFQAPDEGAHALRSFQTSQGESRRAPVPASLKTLMDDFGSLAFHSENKIHFKDVRAAIRVPLNDQDRKYLGSLSVTWIPYLPQSLGIFLGRIFRLPPLALIYLGRTFNLLAWSALMYGAIRRSPVFSWVFLFLALSPMSIYLASSLSHDTFTSGIAFFTAANFLFYAFAKEGTLGFWDCALLILLGVLASLCKAVYFPLIFLYFLIPVRKVGSKARYAGVFLFLFVCSFGADFLWTFYSGVVVSTQRAAAGPNQLDFVKSNPWQFLKIFFRTYWTYGSFFLESFIGKLGWLDTELPGALRAFYLGCLVLILRLDRNPEVQMDIRKRSLLLTVDLAVISLISLGLYLTWTGVGKELIEGIQGRYFIPLSPLICLLFYPRSRAGDSRSGIFFSWIPLASLVILVSALGVMVNRYYYF